MIVAAPFASDTGLSGAGPSDADLAAALFAVDPVGLGGVSLRSGPGPERDAWMAQLRTLLGPATPIGRAPLGIADDRLLGGLDLALSLSAGRPVMERGLLAAHDGGVIVMPMAERLDDGCAARLCAVLDSGEVAVEREGMTARLPARLGLVLLDEGYEPEERPPARLSERLAFLDVAPDAPTARKGASATGFNPEALARARRTLQTTEPAPDNIVEALCAAAAAFGLDSIRPPLLAMRSARAHAALHGRTLVTEEDAAVAVRLVLAPRALTLPLNDIDATDPPADPAADDPPSSDEASQPLDESAAAADRVLEAVQASLPDGLLDRIVADNRRAARAPRRGGAGAAVKAARRGRPIGSRAGKLRDGDRLDLPATLRAAAPWTRLRAAQTTTGRVAVRAEDFRIRRFVQRRESTTIFVVDASGSAAFQRLAEAKGAVELLLAKAYVSRARVALIAFRRSEAELRLPPTRSLTRARLSLADLPGGGGTPLALGLDAGLSLALAERAKERTPILVVLSDGRANVASDGAGGREAAERDALAAAKRIGAAGIDAAYMDTSPRPQPGGDRFARAMVAVYAPLPYADPARVSSVVGDLRSRP